MELGFLGATIIEVMIAAAGTSAPTMRNNPT
jgi:hypothetical protein